MDGASPSEGKAPKASTERCKNEGERLEWHPMPLPNNIRKRCAVGTSVQLELGNHSMAKLCMVRLYLACFVPLWLAYSLPPKLLINFLALSLLYEFLHCFNVQLNLLWVRRRLLSDFIHNQLSSSALKVCRNTNSSRNIISAVYFILIFKIIFAYSELLGCFSVPPCVCYNPSLMILTADPLPLVSLTARVFNGNFVAAPVVFSRRLFGR